VTTPRFWTDPLSGTNYSARQRLLSAQMNNYRDAMLGLDFLAFGNALQTGRVYSSSSYIAAVEFPAIGALVALTATTAELLQLNNPALRIINVADTLPGSPTLGSAGGAYNGSNLVVFASGGYGYYMGTSNSWARTAFNSSALGNSITYSETTGAFYVAATDVVTGYVQSTTDGVSWTTEHTSANSAHKWIARNSDGSKLMAAGIGSNGTVSYSSDGGQSWTDYATTCDGSSTFDFRCLTYDDRNAQWLCTTDVSGGALKVWKLSDPTVTTTWTLAATAPSAIRGASTYISAGNVIGLPGGAWAVSVGENTYGDVCITTDQGLSWERMLGISSAGGGSNTAHRLRRAGQRLSILLGDTGASSLYVTNPLWPDFVTAL
jgi:hypothetical protein